MTQQIQGPLAIADELSHYRIATMDAAQGLIQFVQEMGPEYREYVEPKVAQAIKALSEAMTALGMSEAFLAGVAATNARRTREAIDNELSSKTAYRA